MTQKKYLKLTKISPDLEYMAQEAECVTICLNERGIPKHDKNGQVLSLWGRVKLYAQLKDS